VLPFSKLAAAAALLKIDNPLQKEHLQPDSDESRFTVVKAHAEFKIPRNGPSPPFSKMSAAAMLKIDNLL
jgi:hypothetical protein